MLEKVKDNGVSPVIGVILMVAVTVIVAGLVAAFVFGLTDQLDEEPEATVSFDQEIDNFDEGTYTVRVTAQQLDNADYLRYQIVGPNAADGDHTVDNLGSDPDTSPSNVPADDGQHFATESGDAIELGGLQDGDEVQVSGVLEGDEAVITTYSVDDVQNFASE